MQKQTVRVVLASEHPQIRYFLSEVLEQEDGVDIVGQAQDASKALTLVRNLRPDVAVIDCYLPHIVRSEATPLSRINGLDTAQAISKEIPNTKAILLSNLNADALLEGNLGADSIVFFSREKTGENIPFTLQELYQETVLPSTVVFAGLEVKQQAAFQQGFTRISDKVIFFGAIAFAGGWLLTLTMMLLPIGVPLALAGAATVVLGLTVKLTASLRRKVKSNTKKASHKVR